MKQDKKDALDLLLDEVKDDPIFMRAFEEERLKADAAQVVYDLRAELGASLEEFAKKVNLTSTTIEDLEAADYEGDLFGALLDIAFALGRHVNLSIE